MCTAAGLFCNDACMCRDCENRTDTLNAVFKARKFIMVKDPTAFKPKVTYLRHLTVIRTTLEYIGHLEVFAARMNPPPPECQTCGIHLPPDCHLQFPRLDAGWGRFLSFPLFNNRCWMLLGAMLRAVPAASLAASRSTASASLWASAAPTTAGGHALQLWQHRQLNAD